MDITEQRIENIKAAVERGTFDTSVEPEDHAISADERKRLVQRRFDTCGSLPHRLKHFISEAIADAITRVTQKIQKY